MTEILEIFTVETTSGQPTKESHMQSQKRRLKTIELDLSPQQVVVLWLRNALQAGTFEEGAPLADLLTTC
jgi:hypothetical protein